MTTRTKLNAASLTASTMGLLVVASNALRFPSWVEWLLLILMWIPLGLVFSYNKKLKAERAAGVVAGTIPVSKVAQDHAAHRRRLIWIWIGMVPFTLSFPLWLPSITGRSLGRMGDIAIALTTLAMLSVMIWIQLRKMAKEPQSSFSR